MSKKRDAVAQFRLSVDRHLDGSVRATDNARSLLGAAEAAVSHSAATGSFVASMAAEELGKCLLLLERKDILLNNAQIRVDSAAFPELSIWADGSVKLEDVLPWGTFVGRSGTHKGGLRDHRAKLEALRDHYLTFHPHTSAPTHESLTLSFVDIFAGRTVEQVRGFVEKSVYVHWNDTAHAWVEPTPCTPDLDSFIAAMGQVASKLQEQIPDHRENSRARIDYLAGAAESLSLNPSDVFII